MQYLVTATVPVMYHYGAGAKQLPAFVLDSNIQGIINKTHAESIARDILVPGHGRNVNIHVEETATMFTKKELAFLTNAIYSYLLRQGDNIKADGIINKIRRLSV